MKPSKNLSPFTPPSQVNSETKQKYRSFSENLTDNDSDLEDNNGWKSKPDFWSDDTRMNALFAPFRRRDLNPLHYDNKMKFWKEQISAYCKEKQLLQVNLKTLEACFVRKRIKPKCLEAVFAQMVTDGVFKTRADTLKPKLGILRSVINTVIWSPLTWSTNYILERAPIISYLPYQTSNSTPNLTDLNTSQNQYQTSTQYINVSMIEVKSNELLNLLQKNVMFNNVDCLIEYEKVIEMGSQILSGHNDQNDLDLLLRYLEVNHKVVIKELENKKRVVKFANGSQNVGAVTELELSYMQLKGTEQVLECDTNKIENEISALNDTIKVYLKQNNRSVAMKYLKKRKQLEKSLETKDNTLSNIQAMLMSIEQADTNKLTYDAYAKSATALKEANKTVDIDKLDDTMQDLQEMMQVNTEIEEVMKSPLTARFGIDETELNTELAELMTSDATKDIKRELLEDSMDMSDVLKNLPEVPEATPKEKQPAMC